VPAELPSIDVAAAAQAYADFGGLLVAFALPSLFWYLTDRRHHRDGTQVRKGEKPPPVHRQHVMLTVFYATASLAMISFLYANLAGEAVSSPLPWDPTGPSYPPPWAVTALLPYGVVFGLSVLMLFYGLTLIMLEQSIFGVAAWSYWVVACVGPAVVIRFLITAAAAAREARCIGTRSLCGPGWPLSRWGMFWVVVIVGLIAATIILVGLDWPGIRLVRDWLADRPAFPAIVVFVIVSVMTGLVSLYFTGQPFLYHPKPGVVTACFWLAVAAVEVFALTCGCVIGPRVNVSLIPKVRAWLERRNAERTSFLAQTVRGRPFAVRNTESARDAGAVFVILVRDDAAVWMRAPQLREVFALLDEYGGIRLHDLLSVRAEWAVLDGWRPRVKLKLDFHAPVMGSVGVVLPGYNYLDWWQYIADGARVAITTKERLGAAEAHSDEEMQECIRLEVGPSPVIRDMIEVHGWPSLQSV
jgi:hypothetical protein